MAGEPIQPTAKTDPPDWLIEKRKDAIRNCRLFYSGGNRFSLDPDPHFSWECGAGWNDVLAAMSYRIEALNIELYKKYRIKCVAEQIKEKFGTLRVYTRIVVDPPAWKSFLPDVLMKLYNKICALKTDHAMKKVVDRAKHVEYEYELMSKEDFSEAEKGKYKCSNVDYYESGGRYYKVIRLDRYEQTHYEPTKNMLLYRIKNAINLTARRLELWVEPDKQPRVQIVMSEFMDGYVEKIIRDAEDGCYRKCEKCGCDIGTEYSPRCETRGWITYLCEDCAKKQGGNYVKHDRKQEEKKDEDQD